MLQFRFNIEHLGGDSVRECYYIDLDVARPDIFHFSGDELEYDMAAYKAKTVLDLDGFDRRIFKKEADAERFLDRYIDIKNGLKNSRICRSRHLPAMLYKRRYIVQTLMGDKMHTVRSYKKAWRPGILFNLHDQTYFLTVRLSRILDLGNGEYKYEFDLP